jgi:hypothetical protein
VSGTLADGQPPGGALGASGYRRRIAHDASPGMGGPTRVVVGRGVIMNAPRAPCSRPDGGRQEEALVLMTASSRRYPVLAMAPVTAMIAIAALLGAAVAPLVPPDAPAAAQPDDSATDDEGGSSRLRKVLQAAGKGYADAKVKLDNSKKRQLAMNLELRELEARHAALSTEIGQVAAHAYRSGRLTDVSVLLESDSADSFWRRATTVDALARVDAKQLRRLAQSRDRVVSARTQIAAEIREQTKQLAVMKKRKQDAQQALVSAGGGRPSGGYVSANSPLAKAAPRNSDGSWPSESCKVDDPTTSGCITPRTLHAMNQAKAAGFTRHMYCHRSNGDGEHPKGRACDFSAAAGGFKDENATGGDRTYGNNVAAFFVKNANRLGVMYVIWYREIWMPGSGWSSYSGSGSPAATHTNHVHLSML